MTTTTTTIQSRRDTTSTWKSVNPKPKAGEICYETDQFKRTKIGDGSTNWNNLKHLTDSEEMAFTRMSEAGYAGKDLSIVFAHEISAYSSIFEWLNARAAAGNAEGIHINDYVMVHNAAGTCGGYPIAEKTQKARIVGIAPYKGYGDQSEGFRFYFLFEEGFGNIPMQTTNNNNGTAENKNPYLSSIPYAVMNGVNNLSTNAYNSVSHGVNASAGGILQLMDSDFIKYTKNPRRLLPDMYSASGLITVPTGWTWHEIGKMFFYNEFEVFGAAIHSSAKNSDGTDLNVGGQPVQLAGFRDFAGDVNKKCNRRLWWLLSTVGGSSSRFCHVNTTGFANGTAASATGVSVRPGFCI